MTGLLTSTSASTVPIRPQLLTVEDGPVLYVAIRFPKGFHIRKTEEQHAYVLSEERNGHPIFEKAYGRGLISHLAEKSFDTLPKISRDDERILLYKLSRSEIPEILTPTERYIAILKVLQEFHSDMVSDYETLVSRTDELMGQYSRIVTERFVLQ